MKHLNKQILSIVLMVFIALNASCQTQKGSVSESEVKVESKKNKKRKKKFKLPEIDLTHWSLTIPEGENGKAKSFKGKEVVTNYATNEEIKPYMYNDSTKGALVFYSYPSKATTANTKYSRSELREQMVPGDNNVNWTFKEGAYMKGKLAMEDVTKDADGKYHRVIVMQIHGRLSDEQRDLIGQKDNNAPPILKIYWDKGKIRVKTKVLKNLNATPEEMLHKDAWGDDEGFNFEQEVGFKKFILEVKVSDGKMVIALNKNEFKVYENIHMRKWGIFENYFKAGNYFQSRDEGAYAKVRYYDLEVKH
ncbi:polysaccharide lyase family 7 protein [uncultured Lacinutrix sp.]|uniref:polysaccharide lyase family 7 protein n=1 Tax=uncultured Lacinutrix sp. TaxID=574032 RepID=UPI00262E53CF|nr:polysaccharide lyase family 7 protein [uncultured Lacinutrix sp.]